MKKLLNCKIQEDDCTSPLRQLCCSISTTNASIRRCSCSSSCSLLMTAEAAEVDGEDMKRCFRVLFRKKVLPLRWVQGHAFFVELLRSVTLVIGWHAYRCAYRICVLCLEARVSYSTDRSVTFLDVGGGGLAICAGGEEHWHWHGNEPTLCWRCNRFWARGAWQWYMIMIVLILRTGTLRNSKLVQAFKFSVYSYSILGPGTPIY